MAEDIPRTSEYNLWGLVQSAGNVGKPGRYEDPDLFKGITQAFTQLIPAARYNADERLAETMGVTNPQASVSGIASGVSGLLSGFQTITEELLHGVDSVWRDPDTGDINTGTGATTGRKFAETVTIGGQWLQQARGFFNTGYEGPNEPVQTAAANNSVGNATNGIPMAALAVAALLVFAAWGN